MKKTHDRKEHLGGLLGVDFLVLPEANLLPGLENGLDEVVNLLLVIYTHVIAGGAWLLVVAGALFEHEGAVIHDESHLLFRDPVAVSGVKS